jgi:transposase
MWTAGNRARYNRDRLRYPSDLTDEEWAHIEPLIAPGKRGGGKRRVNMREVVNGVMYILSTGCQWRYGPVGRGCSSRVRRMASMARIDLRRAVSTTDLI